MGKTTWFSSVRLNTEEKIYRSEDTSVDNEMDIQTSVYNSMQCKTLLDNNVILCYMFFIKKKNIKLGNRHIILLLLSAS